MIMIVNINDSKNTTRELLQLITLLVIWQDTRSTQENQ